MHRAVTHYADRMADAVLDGDGAVLARLGDVGLVAGPQGLGAIFGAGEGGQSSAGGALHPQINNLSRRKPAVGGYDGARVIRPFILIHLSVPRL
jgi:hypothetical protein